MPHSLTITAPVGPGLTVTSLVFDDVQALHFNLTGPIEERKELEVVYNDPDGNEKRQQFDIDATTTITDTITNGNHAWVVSQ